MIASVIASVAMGAAVVQAQGYNFSVIPPVPKNGQIGAFRFPIACKIFNFLPISLDGFYTATAPVYGSPGQPIYYTDVTAIVTVPSLITNLGAAVGVTHANALVFVDISNSNADPTTLAVFPNGLQNNNLPLTVGGTLAVRVPPVKGVLPPIGPFTMGPASGGDNNIYLGNVKAVITLFNKDNKTLITANVQCPALEYPVDLGTISIDGPTDKTPLKVENGFEPTFPPLVDNQEVGYFRLPYVCDLGPLKGVKTDLIFGGQLFSGYVAGSNFSLTNITAQITIPQKYINAAKQAYNAATFVTTVNEINIGLSNASPPGGNTLSKPITLTNAVSSKGGLVINVPASGVLTAGPFTAGTQVNEFMSLTLGSSSGSLQIKDASGKTTLSGALSCDVTRTTTVYEILINPVPKS